MSRGSRPLVSSAGNCHEQSLSTYGGEPCYPTRRNFVQNASLGTIPGTLRRSKPIGRNWGAMLPASANRGRQRDTSHDLPHAGARPSMGAPLNINHSPAGFQGAVQGLCINVVFLVARRTRGGLEDRVRSSAPRARLLAPAFPSMAHSFTRTALHCR